MNRTVAIISYDFTDRIAGASIRSLAFARGLPAYGWNPLVLTSTPQEDCPELPGGRVMSIRSPERDWGGGIAISAEGDSRLGGNPGWLRALAPLKRLVPLERTQVWNRPFRQVAGAMCREAAADAVLTVTQPFSLMPLGDQLAGQLGVPHVIDLRDDWMWRFRIEKRSAMNRWLTDRQCMRYVTRSDAVTVICPLTGDRLRKSGVGTVLIPNGYVESDFAEVPMSASAVEPGGPLTLVHLGWIGGFRSLAGLLGAMELLAAESPTGDPGIRIVQYGLTEPDERGPLESGPMAPFVSVLPQVSHPEAVRVMASSDVLLAVPGHAIPAAVSGKLYEYLRARRPVLLLANEGAASSVMADVGEPWIAPPNSPERIADQLRSMRNEKQAGSLRAASVTERVVAYKRAHGVQRLAGLLDELCAGG